MVNAMPDVFLSYANEDRVTAERFARGLEASGLSVWWDRHLRGGADFAREIERALQASEAVIVLWSARSLDSDRVRDYWQSSGHWPDFCTDATLPYDCRTEATRAKQP